MSESPWSFLSPDRKVLDAGMSGSKSLSAMARKDKVTFYSDADEEINSHAIFDLNKASQVVREVHLQNQCNHVVALSDDSRDKLFRMDVERGTVVGEYGVRAGDNDAINVLTMTPGTKYSLRDDMNGDVLNYYGVGGGAQGSSHTSTSNSTIMQVTIDTRVKDPFNVADDNSRDYKTSRFTCISTSRYGHLAAGSEDGTVRLYTDVHSKASAKMMIDTYKVGLPVLGIDLSVRGDLLCWTYKSYVIVTRLSKDHWTKGKKAAGGEPVMVKLVISSADVQKHGLSMTECTFLPAKFDAGASINPDDSDIVEEYIVSFFGPVRCTWGLRKIEKLFGELEEARAEGNDSVRNEFPAKAIAHNHNNLVYFTPETGRDKTDVMGLTDGLLHLKVDN